MTIIRRKPQTYPGHIRDFAETLFSRSYLQGPYLEKLEQGFRQLVGVQHAILTSFGLHALSIILKFHHLDREGELLVPGYTAGVVQKCLQEMRVNYVCVDIDPATGNMSLADLKRKLTPNSKGILITHLFGSVCETAIFELARERNLIIIEDCAHAHGASLNGKMAGSLGHAGFFSLSYSKLMNTYTGGVLVTNDPALAQFARQDLAQRAPYKRRNLLRKFIMGHAENVAGVPWVATLLKPLLSSPERLKSLKNFVNTFTRQKMTQFFQYSNTQARLGIHQLGELNEMLRVRREKAEFVIKHTKLQFLHKRPEDVYYNLIAIVPNAQHYQRELLKHGVDTGIGASIMEVISPSGHNPGCSSAHKQYLLLPNYGSLSNRQLDHLVTAINSVQRAH